MEIQTRTFDTVASYTAPQTSGSQTKATAAPTSSHAEPVQEEAADLFQEKAGKPLDLKKVEAATEQMNKIMDSFNTNIKFSIHEKLNRLYVQVVDKDGTVLKQFPPQELLDTLANISEYIGIILDKKA